MSTSDVRAWARANGFQVGTRGRFSRELLDAYATAHQAPAPSARPTTRRTGKTKAQEKVLEAHPEAVVVRRHRRDRGTTALEEANRVEGPIRTDWTVTKDWKYNGRSVTPGTELSIKGERGRFRFVKHVIRPNGIEWIDVWGGPKKSECFRSFRPDRIRRIHRLNQTGANLLKARREAA